MGDNGNVWCSEVREALAEAADVLRQLPSEEWAGWLIYVLESLDGDVSKREFRHVLVKLGDAIDDRARYGRW